MNQKEAVKIAKMEKDIEHIRENNCKQDTKLDSIEAKLDKFFNLKADKQEVDDLKKDTAEIKTTIAKYSAVISAVIIAVTILANILW